MRTGTTGTDIAAQSSYGGTPLMPPNSQSWGLYRGTGLPGAPPEEWPEAPAWRSFGGGPELPPPPVDDPYARAVLGDIGQPLPAPPDEVARVNVALHLRRPLLVTGEPGTGKSSLAYRISGELGLGRVLRWQITSLSTLREGLYDGPYEGRGDDGREGEHGGGIRLGPLGTAFLPYRRPRVLLIDRLDRAEISLPEDLCTVLTAGGFVLPGAGSTAPRVSSHDDPSAAVPLPDTTVRCRAFPVVVITTTGERDLPPDLVHRCVTLRSRRPEPDLLRAIAANRFPSKPGRPGPAPDAVDAFVERATAAEGPVVERFLDALRLAADGVLGAVAEAGNWQEAVDTLWQWTAPEEP
ncbi:MoxR family ATPase [Streptomyces sp. NBC_01340]|uniref:MoxR family ATPase n=1 Tax=unclassified Streptomyces TaxID=2593676 RepID=UPI00224D4B12|nr:MULTISPECIES: MoxR family ATPase [unclassified Streptomyces]MCX4454727.1 MoxR family ATPase [Streptomyces sp. NBC_01719]MCX4494087.1 MoxR family ATPase [Streptomyces sp. NBC_01728]WSI39156.1 MoxR family ATPase [Streptomyces sp. NBC_01340]